MNKIIEKHSHENNTNDMDTESTGKMDTKLNKPLNTHEQNTNEVDTEFTDKMDTDEQNTNTTITEANKINMAKQIGFKPFESKIQEVFAKPNGFKQSESEVFLKLNRIRKFHPIVVLNIKQGIHEQNTNEVDTESMNTHEQKTFKVDTESTDKMDIDKSLNKQNANTNTNKMDIEYCLNPLTSEKETKYPFEYFSPNSMFSN